jgi:hypothetical protein
MVRRNHTIMSLDGSIANESVRMDSQRFKIIDFNPPKTNAMRIEFGDT